VKVKKRKEQWEAAYWDGAVIPEDIEQEFTVEQGSNGWWLFVKRYNPDTRVYDEWDVPSGHYLVWSNRGKVKIMYKDEFEENWEKA
jgi:hypothetical protein